MDRVRKTLQNELEVCAEMKCRAAFERHSKPVLVEDVSLYFDAWNGLPGPYVKWFTSGPGVHDMVKMLSPFENKSAEAWCIYGLMLPAKHTPKLFIGKVRGKIVEPRGRNGFGFDSIFVPTGETMTFAEMDAHHKNKVSHRKQALDKLVLCLNDIRFPYTDFDS